MQNITITDIPDFLQKESKTKKTISSSLLKCRSSSVWDKPLLFIRKNLELRKVKLEVKPTIEEEQIENMECLKKRDITITDIPNFLQKESKARKTISSSILKLYFSSAWNKLQLFVLKKSVPQKVKLVSKSISKEGSLQKLEYLEMKYEKKPIKELQALRNLIYNYFYLKNTKLRDYYFNYEKDACLEYQNELNHSIQTLTQIVPKCLQPYMCALAEDLKIKGLQLTYSFPLQGECGIVTATNIVKEKTRN